MLNTNSGEGRGPRQTDGVERPPLVIGADRAAYVMAAFAEHTDVTHLADFDGHFRHHAHSRANHCRTHGTGSAQFQIEHAVLDRLAQFAAAPDGGGQHLIAVGG